MAVLTLIVGAGTMGAARIRIRTVGNTGIPSVGPVTMATGTFSARRQVGVFMPRTAPAFSRLDILKMAIGITGRR